MQFGQLDQMEFNIRGYISRCLFIFMLGKEKILLVVKARQDETRRDERNEEHKRDEETDRFMSSFRLLPSK